MSADRYTICPKCYVIKRREMEEKIKLLKEELKGELSPDQIIRKRLELDELSEKCFDEESFETKMRENYYIGTDVDGVLYIEYACYCCDCKFKKTYSTEIVLIEKEIM